MGPWNSDWENDPGYFSVDETVWDIASIRGYGPGEQVWYYLDTDVLEQARGRITFRGTFLRVDYEKA